MRLSLISIETGTTPLDGLFYEPDGPVRGCVQLFHGQAMNFHVGHSRFLPPALVDSGFACLAYNRRAHDILSTRDNVFQPEGSAFVRVAEALEDDTIARDWLLDRGYPAPHLVGHSFGGMLAVAHAAARSDTPSLSLLSPIRGGADLVAATGRNGLLGAERTDEIVQQAQFLAAEGRGDELMLMPRWWHVLSANALIDLLTEAPDILLLAEHVTAPTLGLRGSLERAEVYPIEEFAERAGGEVKTTVVEGAHHFYSGHEEQVVRGVVDWISAHTEVPAGTLAE
jgi:pimeloyl-ACP methyl ester carboxylesterase